MTAKNNSMYKRKNVLKAAVGKGLSRILAVTTNTVNLPDGKVSNTFSYNCIAGGVSVRVQQYSWLSIAASGFFLPVGFPSLISSLHKDNHK